MSSKIITWIDVETNDLYPEDGTLLEVACLVTDGQLNVLDETGYTAAVLYSKTAAEQLKANTNEFVQQMHTATGLWDRLLTGKPLTVIDEELVDYISQYSPEPRVSWLGGNSITLDRGFLRKYTPQTFNHLHYRSHDVTTIAGLADEWYGVSYEKKATHNAMSDILESIEELRFLRKKVFK
jgi:oligoribonuclease